MPQTVDIRSLGGKRIELDLTDASEVRDVREQIGVALGLRKDFFKMVCASGVVPDDGDPVSVLESGTTYVIILEKQLEEAMGDAGRSTGRRHLACYADFGLFVDVDLSRLKARDRLLALPESFGQFTALQKLNLENNEIRSLPESFCQLKDLVRLFLSNNKLRSLPENFGGLTALQYLTLEKNELSSLPETFGRLTALQSIYLAKNLLSSLPDSFGHLKALQKFYAPSNMLSLLPGSFGQLSTLQYLNLQGNRLIMLPQSFGQLQALRSLILEGNELRSLPDSFGQLKSLEYLKLDILDFSALPLGLGFGTLRPPVTNLHSQSLHLGHEVSMAPASPAAARKVAAATTMTTTTTTPVTTENEPRCDGSDDDHNDECEENEFQLEDMSPGSDGWEQRVIPHEWCDYTSGTDFWPGDEYWLWSSDDYWLCPAEDDDNLTPDGSKLKIATRRGKISCQNGRRTRRHILMACRRQPLESSCGLDRRAGAPKKWYEEKKAKKLTQRKISQVRVTKYQDPFYHHGGEENEENSTTLNRNSAAV